MEDCPVCRAKLNDADICRRCRAELGVVKEVDRRAETFAGEAMRALASVETTRALQLLRRARTLHATPEIRGLLSRLEAAPLQRSDHLRLGSALAKMSQKIGLTNAVVEALEPARDHKRGFESSQGVGSAV